MQSTSPTYKTDLDFELTVQRFCPFDDDASNGEDFHRIETFCEEKVSLHDEVIGHVLIGSVRAGSLGQAFGLKEFSAADRQRAVVPYGSFRIVIARQTGDMGRGTWLRCLRMRTSANIADYRTVK